MRNALTVSRAMILPPMAALNRHLEHLARDVLLELFCHLAGTGIGAVGMDDKGEGVHHLAADHDVQFDQLGLLVAGKLIVKGGISLGAGSERIEKVVDNLVERQLVVQLYAVGVQILGILIGAAALLTQLHDGDVGGGSKDAGFDIWLLCRFDVRRVGVVGRVVNHHHAAVGHVQLIDYAGSGGNQIQVELSFQTLLDNLHVQQSQKSAAESKAQRLGGLRLKGQRSVVELQLVQRVAQVGIFCTIVAG